MQVVARLLPPSYVFEGMRAIVLGQPFQRSSLAGCALLSIADVLAACATFTRVYRHAVRSGLIARYSAESVS